MSSNLTTIGNSSRTQDRKEPLGSAALWLAIAMAGIFAFFWDGLTSLLVAWQRPEYSYGPLVPVITAYMTLRELHKHPVTPNRDSRIPGIAVICLGLVLGMTGNLAKIPDIITYGFIIVIGGFVLILAGWRQGMRFWPGWLHLIFMLPLPNVIYWPLSTKLQFLSSEIGVEFIYLLGIPVYLDGNIIDLGIYKLQVAEACNGLRYLFPLMSFGWLFAVLYNGPGWHRVVLFLSTIPITILMNSFRIGVIGVLVNYFGIGQAEGFLHYFEGWIIFITCVLVLFIEAWLLQRIAPNPRALSNIIDIDFEGIIGPLSKIRTISTSPVLITTSLLVLVAGGIWQIAPTQSEPVVDRQPLIAFPMQLADWRGKASKLDPTIEKVLGADDYLIADYRNAADASNVNLFVSYYKSQTAGEGIHSPEVCIPGGGWEVSQWSETSVDVTSGATLSFTVNRAIIQKGQERQLVYYWFEQRGRKLTSDISAKLYTVWDSITQSRSDGALVRVITHLKVGEPENAADKRLRSFLQHALPMLESNVPGAWQPNQ